MAIELTAGGIAKAQQPSDDCQTVEMTIKVGAGQPGIGAHRVAGWCGARCCEMSRAASSTHGPNRESRRNAQHASALIGRATHRRIAPQIAAIDKAPNGKYKCTFTDGKDNMSGLLATALSGKADAGEIAAGTVLKVVDYTTNEINGEKKCVPRLLLPGWLAAADGGGLLWLGAVWWHGP